MSLAYLFDSNIQFQDKSGNNNVNGFLRVYIDNTDDRAVTYKDFNGTLNQADIRLDNNGRAVVIVDDSKTYRLEVYGTTGVLLWTLYPISPKATGINETLEALVAAVKSHTIAIEGLALGKKNKQQAKVISGTPTKTVKSISQNADGEITVEFEDIDFPYNTEISSPDGSIEVGTPVVDPVLKKETIPLSVANKGKVLIDENDSQQKYLEDAVKADENGLLLVRVDEKEDSTPENPNKVLIIDDSSLVNEIERNAQRIEDITEAIDELDMDSVPHAYLHSSLNQSAGDSTTTRTTVDIFACNGTPEGDCFEFEQTTTIDDTPYGYLWVEPGTYLINGSVTLQWVGNPRGTFVAKVGSVMGENFDFSQEQEILRNHTKIVTIPNRMKLAINITYDAGTPVMGLWIQSLQVVKLAGGMSQTNIMHDSTLTGEGSVSNPLGVDEAKVAQSTLAGNLAPAFDPTRTEDDKYLAGQTCVKDGVQYKFVHDHFGVWNDDDAVARPASELYAQTDDVRQISKKVQSVDIESTFESESNEITIEDDDGNEIIRVDENGADFRGLKKNGEDVLTEGKYPMGSETLSTLADSVIIEDDDGNEIIRVDENGVFVRGVKIRNNVVVAADGSGDYMSIQSAINASDNGSVIIVMPGEYEESVDMGHKELYLIGMNKDTCIVRQGKRDYYHPPLWIGCGFVSNMTFYLYNGDEVITPDKSTYAVHLDQRWHGSRSVTFDNCKFKNDWLGATIGCGVSKDCKIRLVNCEFENNANTGAAFQLHTSDSEDCIGEWNYIEMIGCYCTGSNTSAGVLLANSSASSIESASGVKCRFIGNDIGFYSSITSAYQLQKGSFNNTNSNLNYGG